MAGYRVPRRTALISFEGTDYDGAEIECRLDVPLGMLFEFTRATASGENEDVFRRWAETCLLGWNLEDDDGVAIPPTPDGLLSLPPALVTVVFRRWTAEVTTVPAPLAVPSPGGGI